MAVRAGQRQNGSAVMSDTELMMLLAAAVVAIMGLWLTFAL